MLPILGGPLTTGFVTTFVRAITTLSVVIFLFTPQTSLATIRIFQLVNDFNWGGATAFTVSVIVMAIVVLLVVWKIAGRRVRLDEVRAVDLGDVLHLEHGANPWSLWSLSVRQPHARFI